MKKKESKIFFIFYFLFFIFYFLSPLVASAVTPTPTPLSPTEIINEQINALRNRITSKVAQMKLVEKRGVIGKITDVSNTQITITNVLGNIVFIDFDELTKFSSPNTKTSFGISDVAKGMNIGILGLYNKESRRILARFVNVLNMRVFIHGVTSSVDNKNFTFDVISENNKISTIDVGSNAKTFSYIKSAGFTRSGFSKIKDDEAVIVSGVQDDKNKNLIIAMTIIVFPEISKNAKISAPEMATPTIPTSTGSGKKLKPIIK